MRDVLDLPEHDLAICLAHLRELPSDQHRVFLEAVGNYIDQETFVPGELTAEVISACHLARFVMSEVREVGYA